MPEVRHFIYESVLKNEYKGLSVKFIPGATPELVILKKQVGKDAEEASREVIVNLSAEQLHVLVQERGFKRVSPEEREQPPGPGNDDAEEEGVTLPGDGLDAEQQEDGHEQHQGYEHQEYEGYEEEHAEL